MYVSIKNLKFFYLHLNSRQIEMQGTLNMPSPRLEPVSLSIFILYALPMSYEDTMKCPCTYIFKKNRLTRVNKSDLLFFFFFFEFIK